MTGYAYVKIRGTWYHLQNHAWDTKYNGQKNGATYLPLSKLAALAQLSYGLTKLITNVTDVTPKGDGPAKPGYLLPYVDHRYYSAKMLMAMHRRLEKLGMEFPKRMGAGYIEGITPKP